MKLKLSVLLCLLLGCLNSNISLAQPSLFSYEKYISSHKDTLPYRMLYPDYDTLRKYPLVIFLHGSGERGNDNEAQLKWGVKNFATDQQMALHPCFVVAPQCPANEGWSNFSSWDNAGMKLLPTPSKPMQLVMELIHQLKQNPSVDTNRIYITGLSMGGYGTFDAIARYPNLFAAAVPVCGAGDTARAASMAHLPIWIFTGAEDAAVNPVLSQNMVQALTHAGAHPGFTQYPEVGHFSWISAYSDVMMMEWLFRQRR